jgi:2-polyprenyl-6-methoxyphenol hydroxylase-like FAD-dependent oxidoreductase
MFYSPGTIYLASGAEGYLGLVRVEDGQLDIAAAMDRTLTRRAGSPGAAAAVLLEEVGWPPVNGMDQLSWRGTPPLTRRVSRFGGERLFVLGDAAVYVEPFTGEGIAWALASAAAVVPFAEQAVRRWRPALSTGWAREHRRLFQTRHRVCRLVAQALRRPRLVQGCLTLLARCPGLATPLIRHLNAPSNIYHD